MPSLAQCALAVYPASSDALACHRAVVLPPLQNADLLAPGLSVFWSRGGSIEVLCRDPIEVIYCRAVEALDGIDVVHLQNIPGAASNTVCLQSLKHAQNRAF